MKNKKRIRISGLAMDSSTKINKFLKIGEQADMEKLSKYASKGWLVEKFHGASYILLKK